MLDFLRSIVSALFSFVTFFRRVVEGIFLLLKSIPSMIDFFSSAITALPAWLAPFIYMSLTILTICAVVKISK